MPSHPLIPNNELHTETKCEHTQRNGGCPHCLRYFAFPILVCPIRKHTSRIRAENRTTASEVPAHSPEQKPTSPRNLQNLNQTHLVIGNKLKHIAIPSYPFPPSIRQPE